jgi:hypothetical protein
MMSDPLTAKLVGPIRGMFQAELEAGL